MEFAFRRLNSNTQVSAGEINALPFPPIPDETQLKQIEYLVSALMAWGGVDCGPDTAKMVIEAERHLDILMGSLYGFAASEVEQIQGFLPSYETVYGLTNGETAAVAQSVGRTTSSTKEKAQPEFRVLPNHSGLAPGVTADNLKDILYEMEVEDYMRESAP